MPSCAKLSLAIRHKAASLVYALITAPTLRKFIIIVLSILTDQELHEQIIVEYNSLHVVRKKFALIFSEVCNE